MSPKLEVFKDAVIAGRAWCIEHNKITIAAKALLLGLPPALLGYASQRWASELPLQQSLRELGSTYPWMPLAAILWPLLVALLLEIVADTASRWAEHGEAKRIELMALVTAIEDIVGRKIRRFGEAARGISRGEDGASIFAQITQPERQIEALVQSLWQTLVALTQDRTLKVVLAEISNSIPTSWKFYFPHNAIPPADLLKDGQASKTFFAHCARQRRPVVLADIAGHLANRDKGKNKRKPIIYLGDGDADGDSDSGSIIAYPIINRHLETLPYVLCVKSARGTLDDTFKRQHAFILNAFIGRLEMEHNLLHIKTMVGS